MRFVAGHSLFNIGFFWWIPTDTECYACAGLAQRRRFKKICGKVEKSGDAGRLGLLPRGPMSGGPNRRRDKRTPAVCKTES